MHLHLFGFGQLIINLLKFVQISIITLSFTTARLKRLFRLSTSVLMINVSSWNMMQKLHHCCCSLCTNKHHKRFSKFCIIILLSQEVSEEIREAQQSSSTGPNSLNHHQNKHLDVCFEIRVSCNLLIMDDIIIGAL